jgi:hypothetical protein
VLTKCDGGKRVQAMTQFPGLVSPPPSKLTGTPSASVEVAEKVNKAKKESISIGLGRVGGE